MTTELPALSDAPILLVSPREPSGVSWIINCLLELGIRVDLQPTADQIFGTGRQPASAIWQAEADGRWRLHPRASALQKWLPCLSRTETYSFRPIPPILHVQRLPLRNEQHRQVVLFVRDLRDALHSLYRRLKPELSWPEFVEWPHPETLLDAIDHWRLFIECWLVRPALFVARFEDYKADATALLEQILLHIGVECTSAEIAQATERSSYAAAAANEARYREQHPHDRQVVNRAGRVGEWELLSDLQPAVREMERRAGPQLTRLGYRCQSPTSTASDWESLAVARELTSFATFDIPSSLTAPSTSVPVVEHVDRLRRFIEQLTTERLTGARLEVEETRALLRHLEEFCLRHAPAQTATVRALMPAFHEGSSAHLARIRALLQSRRPELS